MPEKTRDRKNWFPRFKSNWLGTYRSKQMFVCCECAVTDAESARYKGAEGKHCACGRDQWHLAKSVEETEYNRRMEISKSFGGIRYEEALERLKYVNTGSEYPDYDAKRARCESAESSASTSSLTSTESSEYHINKRMKTENGSFTHELQLSLGPNVYGYEQQLPHKTSTSYASSQTNYTPLSVDMLGSAPYDHLAPPPFTDEESFGELLHTILDDDPRGVVQAKTPRSYPPVYHQPMKRYHDMPAPEMDFDFYQGMNAHQAPHHTYSGYHTYPAHHHQPVVASASFPSAV